MHVLVEMQKMKVVEFKDQKLVPFLPPSPLRNYTAGETCGGVYQSDVKPLQIIQPEGPIFHVNGYHIDLQKWNFQIGFTPREGLAKNQIYQHPSSITDQPSTTRSSLIKHKL